MEGRTDYRNMAQIVGGAVLAGLTGKTAEYATGRMYKTYDKTVSRAKRYLKGNTSNINTAQFNNNLTGGIKYKKTYGKRKNNRNKRNYRKKMKRNVKGYQLSRVYKTIKQLKNENAAMMQYRNSANGNQGNNPNECSYYAFSMLSTDTLDTYLQNVKTANYDDVGSTMEIVTKDLTTAGVNGTINIVNARKTILFRNNWAVPVNLAFYWCFPIHDTSVTPQTSIANGLTDRGLTSGEVNLNFWPSDSLDFRRQYKVYKKVVIQLQAGDEYKVVLRRNKPFKWDQDIKDRHNYTYRKGISQLLLVRQWGVVAHDSTNTTTETGMCEASVDWVSFDHVRYGYLPNGGTKQSVVSDGLDTFTNGPIVFGNNVVELEEKGT